jgi:hypothetical protein
VPETVQRADRGGAEPGQVARRRRYKTFTVTSPVFSPTSPSWPHVGLPRRARTAPELPGIASPAVRSPMTRPAEKVSIGGRRRSTEESSRRRLVATVRVACQVRDGGCRCLPLIRIDPR